MREGGVQRASGWQSSFLQIHQGAHTSFATLFLIAWPPPTCVPAVLKPLPAGMSPLAALEHFVMGETSF